MFALFHGYSHGVELPQSASALAYGAGFIAMGVGLEFIQGMTDYRTYDVLDMAANSIGVLLGWGVALLLL